jgi:hypothetical protein
MITVQLLLICIELVMIAVVSVAILKCLRKLRIK